MDRLVESTACPAFRTDSSGRIIAWNPAVAGLLGISAEEVVGRPCHEIVGGYDLFGNRFCDRACPVHNMARRGEPVHHFEMHVRARSGERLRIGLCTLVARPEDADGYEIVHLLQSPWSGAPAVEGHAHREEPGAADAQAGSSGSGPLTPRETQVLGMLERGDTTREISRRLDISVTTVRNHIQGILRKLDAHSRLEAVSVARRQQLL